MNLSLTTDRYLVALKERGCRDIKHSDGTHWFYEMRSVLELTDNRTGFEQAVYVTADAFAKSMRTRVFMAVVNDVYAPEWRVKYGAETAQAMVSLLAGVAEEM